MKRTNYLKIFSPMMLAGMLAVGIGAVTVFAAAGVSSKLSYQGRLTDTSGNPVTNGTYYVCFSIYDAASAGTKLWPAGVPINNAVTVTNGVFNAAVGVSDALTYDFSANDTVYLNVGVAASNVVCDNGAMENLAPRQRVDATAYSRVAYSLYGGDAQVGTAAGVASAQKLLKLDVKTVADTVGASACSPNGAMWYNSGNARTLVCNNNLYQAVGSSIVNQFFDVTGPTTAVKTFTFPDASATVLTSAAAVTIGQGGTGTTTAIAAFNALSPITTKGDLISNDATNDVRLGVGTNGQVLTASSTSAAGIAWATISAGGTNALLDGTSHTDTTAGTVARGDIITGQTATPKWTRLAKGSANQVLSMDGTGTDVLWATPTGGGTPAGADTQIQINNGGAFGADADFTWSTSTNKLTLGGVDTGITIKAITNEPAVPAAGTGVLYMKSIAGRILPKFVGPSGIDFPVQPLIAQDKVAIWNPPGNATTLPGVFGFTAPTTIITATARNVATTNLFTRVRRLGYVSAATAGLLTGHYNVAAGTQWTVGTGAGLGGFFYVSRFGESSPATVAGSREFVGMSSNTAAPTNVEPSTLTNSIGVGYGAADTNLKIFYGGSAAQTPIDLGVNFPARTLSTDMYELILFASPATTTAVGYKVTRLNTNNVAEGTLSGTAGTAIPASTTLLGHRAWITNNATALAVGIDVASVYISSDY